ncbi:polysaccharide deacetylase [Paenibacillus silagei]|uniref:Peptidoglycan/xylan/chitin deacetylase (PgdA/CDA1 family) n=1 Tax=Paenibacillus silagei TaxID=1670801 RepID=A0ABS4NY53_9BACL|nr:polysaccharide deacetylase [Paenibacillus silagei]MBP2114977.1 peptidoglycan/xylan/chitin deacetylase (PgdA/CDA1 family) [Paenibacillus silagei]
MKNNLENPIRRIMICGLLVIAVVLSLGVSAYGGQGNSSGSRITYSLQAEAGSALPLLSKNNAPAVPVQDLPPAAARMTTAESRQPHISGGSTPKADAERPAPAIQQVAAAAAGKAAPAAGHRKEKVVYLTFDDGPSAVTPKVLSILQEQGVKATFFVLGDQAAGRPELIHAIWEQGHAIGNHTYNHNYHDLYSGFTEFWRQIKQTEETVREITGVRPQLVRAPGGTFGHFDSTYFNLLKQAGYRVMDWTVDSGDSRRRGVPAAEIVQASVADLNSASVVLLLHDGSGHEQSAKALPAIIERYRAAGYEFGVLDTQSDPVQFRVSSKAASLQRSKPSQDWISANIAPNAELFAPGKALALEIGRMEIKLKPGEYRLQDGQYYVPLRATVERLGGRVGWDADTRSAAVSWNGRSMTLDSQKQEVGIHWPDGTAEYRAAQVQLQGSYLWVPLRMLLEAAGHPGAEAFVNAEERRVTAA